MRRLRSHRVERALVLDAPQEDGSRQNSHRRHGDRQGQLSRVVSYHRRLRAGKNWAENKIRKKSGTNSFSIMLACRQRCDEYPVNRMNVRLKIRASQVFLSVASSTGIRRDRHRLVHRADGRGGAQRCVPPSCNDWLRLSRSNDRALPGQRLLTQPAKPPPDRRWPCAAKADSWPAPPPGKAPRTRSHR